jgi:MFS family permease
VIAGMAMGILGFGIRYSFGIFFNSLESEFNLSRAATSGVFSTYMLLGGVLSILGGWALDRYGPKTIGLGMSIFTGMSLLASSQVNSAWQLYLTYGVLQALGTGALFALISSTTSRWFLKKRGLVIGITSAAGAIGQIVVPPVSTLLLLHFNWRLSFVILGVLVWAILIPTSRLLKRDPSEIGLLPDGLTPGATSAKSGGNGTAASPDGLLLREAWKVREFWFLGLMWLLSGVSSQMVITHIVPHAIDLGISTLDATFIVSLIGVGAILGRVIDGKLSDSIGRKAPAIASALIQAATLISLIFVRDVWMFYIIGLLFGYGWGGLNTEIVLLISDIFGLRGIGAVMGATLAGFNFGSAIGPAVGGMLYDATGNYSLAFVSAALGMVVATVLGLLIRPALARVK